MTTLQAQSTIGSSPTGTTFNSFGATTTPETVKNNVFHFEISPAQFSPIPNTTSVDDLIKEFEADQEVALALQSSRKSLSEALYGNTPGSFSAIRLAAGLSQSQLASKAATSQSYIAKLEAGRNDPSTEVIAKLAAALNIEEELAFKAIRIQRHMQK